MQNRPGFKAMTSIICMAAILLAFVVVLFALGNQSHTNKFVELKDLYAAFDRAGVTGSMVVADQLILVNKKRAKKRFVPASMFKIANSQ